MISAPQKIHSHAADEIIEEKIENNIEDEAELKQIAAEIANGTVSPKEMHHYKDGLFRTQKAGMKSKKINYSYSLDILFSSNHNINKSSFSLCL